ncbi:MAG: hypothetical protein AAGC60_13325 [Acidobacteriota bacterium]
MFRHFLLFATLFLLASTCGLAADETSPPLEGWLSIVWGDSPDAEQPAHRRLVVTDDSGRSTELAMSDELRGGVFRWNGRRVAVYSPLQGPRFTDDGALRVGALRLTDDAEVTGSVTGSEPWISLLCKFADVATEPRGLTYFQEMYANAPGGLDHYWREVSANAVDVVGSTAVDWVTLPGNQTDYAPTPGSGTTANLGAVFNDCTAAVDDFVDFSRGGSPFAGINIMVNDVLDCCAWGGSRFATLDGVTKSWRVTWNPPWAFNAEAVIAHEMGHGFGLPHANNFDGDGNPYDSPWDVMSSATGYAATDPTYGALGKHVNAYHKDSLGWFPPARRFEAPPDSSTAIELDHTALAGATNYQIAVIPVDGSRWYTVEARLRSGVYEPALVGDAVIIHQVDTSRSEPSWAVDGDEPPANYGDNPGTMWLPGERFEDAANNLAVTVDYATATGFGVTIERGDFDVLFMDGFETGDTTRWSSGP